MLLGYNNYALKCCYKHNSKCDHLVDRKLNDPTYYYIAAKRKYIFNSDSTTQQRLDENTPLVYTLSESYMFA